MDQIDLKLLESELIFSTSRSSGAGGQNVNKVNSKVTLRWSVKGSNIISSELKELLIGKLANQLTVDGDLIISSQEHRSQLQNREAAIKKFIKLLTQASKKRKPRKPSKPGKEATKKRLENKKRISDKKKLRGRIK
jgi:ribosome-associated protein